MDVTGTDRLRAVSKSRSVRVGFDFRSFVGECRAVACVRERRLDRNSSILLFVLHWKRT
jgi:hypothetical protein